MKAFVIEEPGGPEKLLQKEIPLPTWRKDWVLIRVKAFGLNRSEYFTRIGDSPTVQFPRVLGIECVGEVVESDVDGLEKGQKVAAMMGGMGRDFDGSYAEYTLVPRQNVFPINSPLPWNELAALPEMVQTSHGSLFKGLEIKRAKNLLIRGGTSSVGLCSLAIAKAEGIEVTTTTRSEQKVKELKEQGADHVIIDNGSIRTQANEIHPEGYDAVLELVGATTLLDSLALARPGGIVCMTGILGGEWIVKDFNPMRDIPTGVKLTAYSGGAQDITKEELQRYVDLVTEGSLNVRIGKSFPFEQLQLAHKFMDSNKANGKIVVQLS